MRGTRSVPLIFCFSPFEFEQRPLILNRQQPEGRLTAMFVPRSLRRGQTCATDGAKRRQLGYYRESLVQVQQANPKESEVKNGVLLAFNAVIITESETSPSLPSILFFR